MQFEQTPAAISLLMQTLAAFGREDELFAVLLNWRNAERSDDVLDVLFRPALRDFRRDPRMMRVAERLNLLDFWRTTGRWPDFCFEPDLPYDCRREAAALQRKRG